MAWRDPVIDYCERRDHGFWSEPVNALTNIAFLLAAAAAFALWRRRRETDHAALALIVVTALVGVGSFIFHTVATRGAMLFDVVPIAVFIYGYFLLALRRFFGLGALASMAITLLFAAGSYLVENTFHGLHCQRTICAIALNACSGKQRRARTLKGFIRFYSQAVPTKSVARKVYDYASTICRVCVRVPGRGVILAGGGGLA